MEGLNRTSVGLKRDSREAAAPHTAGPQSNQRGIETSGIHDSFHGLASPQSNQRGIETLAFRVILPPAPGASIRTSVGLKQSKPHTLPPDSTMPQSNQRGIETSSM